MLIMFIDRVTLFFFLSKSLLAIDDLEGRDNERDLNEFSSEANVESMLLVERGLRELATLKVPAILIHLRFLQFFF